MQSTRDGSFAVHLVISDNVSWRILVVVVDQELHPNQTVYVPIDARAVPDSSDKPFVGLAGSDFNFAVAEQVIVPNDTMTFPASEASTGTTMVVSFAEPVHLVGGNADPERLADWPQRLSQRGIGQVEGRHEREP